jgi:hypothetical protein
MRNLRACTITRAEGIHIGEAQAGVLGPWLSVSLCGIGSNPILDVYWKVYAGVTEVTCETCYNKALAIHEGWSDGVE